MYVERISTGAYEV